VPRGVALNLVASALTILAAVALLGTATVVGDASVADSAIPAEEQSEAVIHAFYDAIDAALRTGDTTRLGKHVAPDLVIYGQPPGISSDLSGLERHLTTIRSTHPEWRLRVEEIFVTGNRAVAHVAETNKNPGDFLGWRFAPSAMWGQFDVFRIENDRIVELWRTSSSSVTTAPLVQIPFGIPPSNSRAFSLERLAGPAGEDWELGPLSTPRVIYVTAGTLTITIDPISSPALFFDNQSLPALPDEVAPGTSVTLNSGDAVSLPSDSIYRLRHDDTEQDVAAFAVAFQSLSYNGPLVPQDSPSDEPDTEPGARFETILASPPDDPAAQLPADASIAFGRVTMPAGESIVVREAAGPTLLAIESGGLVLQAEHDTTSLERLETGSATLVTSGPPFSLHNLGSAPAAAMVVTILPSYSPPIPRR
jgi:predicted SnoaL-like aldol condensation-catalyzing enzyme